jgi:chemotaxis methyl-accepting protein methylase
VHPRPSKKEFAEWINQITGTETMTESKLDQILHDAKKSVDQKGFNNLFDYMRQLLGVPISNEMMQQVLDKVRSPEGATELFRELQLPVPEEIQKASKKAKTKKSKTAKRQKKKR